MSVDFPDPLGPARPTKSPGDRRTVTSERTSAPSYAQEIPATSRIIGKPLLGRPTRGKRSPGRSLDSPGASSPLSGAFDEAPGALRSPRKMQVHVGGVDVPPGKSLRTSGKLPRRRNSGMDPSGVMKLVPAKTLSSPDDDGVPGRARFFVAEVLKSVGHLDPAGKQSLPDEVHETSAFRVDRHSRPHGLAQADGPSDDEAPGILRPGTARRHRAARRGAG